MVLGAVRGAVRGALPAVPGYFRPPGSLSLPGPFTQWGRGPWSGHREGPPARSGSWSLIGHWDAGSSLGLARLTRPCGGSGSSWTPGPGVKAEALDGHAGAAVGELREPAGLGQDPRAAETEGLADSRTDVLTRESGGGLRAAGSLGSAGPWRGPGRSARCGGGWASQQDCCLVVSAELPTPKAWLPGLASLPASG